MFDKNDAVFEQVDTTGSVDRGAETVEAAVPSAGDLARARAAAVDAMARGVKDSNTPWNNPDNGASGNITPLGTAYSLGDLLCRGFLASYTRGSAQAWLQGEACRTASGKWEVRSLKPLSRG
jgi:surface antigen